MRSLLPSLQDKELAQQIKAIEQRLWRTFDMHSMDFENELLGHYLPDHD